MALGPYPQALNLLQEPFPKSYERLTPEGDMGPLYAKAYIIGVRRWAIQESDFLKVKRLSFVGDMGPLCAKAYIIGL